jgi:hypothetical protein
MKIVYIGNVKKSQKGYISNVQNQRSNRPGAGTHGYPAQGPDSSLQGTSSIRVLPAGKRRIGYEDDPQQGSGNISGEYHKNRQ